MKKFFIKLIVAILFVATLIGTGIFLSREYKSDIDNLLNKKEKVTKKKENKKMEVIGDIQPLYQANSQNMMLKLNLENIDVEPAVKAVLRLGAEEVLTENGYSLLSADSEKNYLKKYNKTECNDTTCIISMAKLLSAKGVFVINAVKLGNSYVFKLTYIDLAKNAASKIKSMLFEGNLNNAKKLLDFSKEMIKVIVNPELSKNNNVKNNKDLKEDKKDTLNDVKENLEDKKDTLNVKENLEDKKDTLNDVKENLEVEEKKEEIKDTIKEKKDIIM